MGMHAYISGVLFAHKNRHSIENGMAQTIRVGQNRICTNNTVSTLLQSKTLGTACACEGCVMICNACYLISNPALFLMVCVHVSFSTCASCQHYFG